MSVQLFYPEGALSGEEVLWCIGGATEHLRSLGIVRGERVALLSENCPEYLIYLEALIELGAVAVLLHERLSDEELQKQIDYLDISYLLQREVNPHLYSKTVRTFSSLQTLNCPGISLSERNARRDPSIVIFTSGSTGAMKAAALSEAQISTSASSWAEYYGLSPRDGYLLSLPLSTVGALGAYYRMKTVSGKVMFPKSLSVDHLILELLKDDITCLSCVPTQLDSLVHHSQGPKALQSLRCILVGGAKISTSLLKKVHDLDLPVYVPYGMTEACSSITSGKLVYEETKQGIYSNGKVGKHLSVSILDPDTNEELQPGQPGKIKISGDSLFCGYMDSLGAVAPVDSFCTGDIGSLDNDGNLFLHGRADRVFKSGGLKIFPDEIEAFLDEQECVEQSAVVPYQSDKWGERPVAYLQSKSKNIDILGMMQRGGRCLAKYKLPDKWIVVDRLPLTVSGKVSLQALKGCRHKSSLFYRTLGDREAPCLLLLHGAMGSGEDWFDIAQALSSDFFVVLPDLPGFGSSCRTEWFTELSFDLVLSELLALVSDLNPSKLYLGGYSLGARMALLLASELEREISGVYLESVQLGTQNEVDQLARIQKDIRLAKRIEDEGLRSFLDYWYHLELFGLERNESLRRKLVEERDRLDPSWVAQSFRKLSPGLMPYLGTFLHEMRSPVVLVTGKRDRKFSEVSRELAASASCISEHLELDAGHMVHREQPGKVIEALRSFSDGR